MLEFRGGDLDLQNKSRCQTLLGLFHFYTTDKAVFDKKSRLKSTLVVVEDNIDSQFRFSAGRYVPTVHGLDAALDRLEELDYIETGTVETQDITYEWYKLTPEGERAALDALEEMGTEKRELLEWVVERHAKRKLGALMSFCYQRKPEFYELKSN